MYIYKTKELEKRGWGIKAIIGAFITLISGAIAMKLASTGRTSNSTA